LKKQSRALARARAHPPPSPAASPFWSAPREWDGQTAFIVAGGPSVRALDTTRLISRKVIALNSSFLRVPFADYLVIGDGRVWRRHWREHRAALEQFTGRIVTLAPINHPRLLRMLAPPVGRDGVARYGERAHELMFRKTVLAAGMNLAGHLGVAGLTLLGADGQRAPDGACHHHAPHPWDLKPGCWQAMVPDLEACTAALTERGVTVRNASPGSAFTLWPIVDLEDVL
jgi:hypothetical protein